MTEEELKDVIVMLEEEYNYVNERLEIIDQQLTDAYDKLYKMKGFS